MTKNTAKHVKGGYRLGCRCAPCTDENRTSHYAYMQRRKAGQYDTPTCAAPDCVRLAMTRSMCTMHYKRWLRANGMDRSPSGAWSDKRRDNYHARRARMAGANNGSPALLSQIIERDGTDCAHCHLPVNLALAWPDRMSKSIDHREPIAHGGSHTLANTQLMHFACNASKGTRTAS